MRVRSTRPACLHAKLCLSILSAILFCGKELAAASDCRPLTDEIQAHIENYLSHRHVDPNNVEAKPKIKSAALVPNSCFWKIEVELSDLRQPVIVYLSPDQRFVTSAVYDLTVDPELETAKIAWRVESSLMQEHSPSVVGSKSHISIVEFSDLECPFCKSFAGWYDSLPENLRSQTTLVYKHFPLPQHPWARDAAIYAARAERISPSQFWRVTHRLFDLQSQITTDSLEAEVFKTLAPGDEKGLKTCAISGEGARIVDRDIALARQLAISATPTVFINGHRVMHIRSEKTLEDLIKRVSTEPKFLQSNIEPVDSSRRGQ
jgi:protein-disulfide isomerase